MQVRGLPARLGDIQVPHVTQWQWSAGAVWLVLCLVLVCADLLCCAQMLVTCAHASGAGVWDGVPVQACESKRVVGQHRYLRAQGVAERFLCTAGVWLVCVCGTAASRALWMC